MQIMDHAAYDARRKPHPPSEAEIRNQAWQALIGGARGCCFIPIPICFTSVKPAASTNGSLTPRRGVAAVSQQIAAFTPYLLTGKSTPLAGSDPQMPARMFILGDRALLLVANPYYREGSTRLRLPAGWRQQDGGGDHAGVARRGHRDAVAPALNALSERHAEGSPASYPKYPALPPFRQSLS